MVMPGRNAKIKSHSDFDVGLLELQTMLPHVIHQVDARAAADVPKSCNTCVRSGDESEVVSSVRDLGISIPLGV